MLEKLGPYQFENVLGRGGMGTVYRGIHAQTGECHAVKVLAPQFADDSHFRGRFESEIEAMMKLDHPNIVRLLSHGQEDGNLFFSMELVQGKSLYDMQRGGHGFLWPQCMSIAIDVCKGLKHAHDRGIIHRDLKPGNLLMTSDGLVKITDFGIAKSYGGSHQTGTNILGTMDYMAPEQAKGEPVTVRSDVYSLGTVLYTLMTGKPPFTANSMEESFRNLTRVPAPKLSSRIANVPSEVEDLLSKMLEKKPEKRIATAQATLHQIIAIQELLKGESQAKTAEQGPLTTGEMAVIRNPSDKTAQVDRGAIESSLREKRDEGSTRISPIEGKTISDKTSLDLTPMEAIKPPSKKLKRKPKVAHTKKNTRRRNVTGKKIVSPGEDYFVPVTQEQRAAVQGDANEHLANQRKWPIALLFLATLGITIFAAWYATKGRSADALYVVIQKSFDSPELVIPETTEFIERFKEDDRLGEVELLNRVGRSVKNYTSLVKRLTVRARIPGDSRLTEIEDQFLKIVTLGESNPQLADAKMVAFMNVYSKREDLPQRDRDCVEAAEGFRIMIAGAEERQIKSTIRNIDAIFLQAEQTTIEDAIDLYQGIIRLYSDDHWGEMESDRKRLMIKAAQKTIEAQKLLEAEADKSTAEEKDKESDEANDTSS